MYTKVAVSIHIYSLHNRSSVKELTSGWVGRESERRERAREERGERLLFVKIDRPRYTQRVSTRSGKGKLGFEATSAASRHALMIVARSKVWDGLR